MESLLRCRSIGGVPVVTGGKELVFAEERVSEAKLLTIRELWCRDYLGVSFNSLLAGGVRGDTVPVPLSVNT